MKILEKWLLAMEITIQLVVCWTISTLKKYYKMIAVGSSKEQALDADPKAIKQINFTANLDRAGNTRFYFILEEVKLFLNFHKAP